VKKQEGVKGKRGWKGKLLVLGENRGLGGKMGRFKRSVKTPKSSQKKKGGG